MAVLSHEGTYPVMYGALPISVGVGYRNGYLARPDRSGRFPVVVLIPDIAGITAHEKQLARRLARRGIAVVGVDLYAAHRAATPMEIYNDFDDGDAVRVLDEVQEYLCSEDIDWANSHSLGLLGIEVGGRFAIIQTASRTWAGSAGLVYTPITGDESRRYQVADMLQHVARPVLGIYGAEDDLIDQASVDEAQNRNTSGSWLLYESVGHGFLNESQPGYDEASAEDAIVRIADFFLGTLPAASVEELG